MVLIFDGQWKSLQAAPPLLIVSGAVAVWVPWLLYILTGWDDFVAQVANYANRFNLFDPLFYLHNLVYEPQRYDLGWTTLASALLQPGVWLLIAGVPAALLLQVRAEAQRALLVATLFFPPVYALLLWQKTPGYLLSVLHMLPEVAEKLVCPCARGRSHAALVA